MRCKKCDIENREEAQFCKSCGQNLCVMKECPYCAEKILAKAKKCKHCGSSLDEEKVKDNGVNKAIELKSKISDIANPGYNTCKVCFSKIYVQSGV